MGTFAGTVTPCIFQYYSCRTFHLDLVKKKSNLIGVMQVSAGIPHIEHQVLSTSVFFFHLLNGVDCRPDVYECKAYVTSVKLLLVTTHQ